MNKSKFLKSTITTYLLDEGPISAWRFRFPSLF